MTEIYQFLARGGVIMIPIGLGSVVALTIFLERLWALQTSRIHPPELIERVVSAVAKRDNKTARDECLKSDTPLGRVLLAGLDSFSRSVDEIKIILEEVGRREVTRMERYIEAIGTTASIEPLLGLLGTVVGMIQVFQKVVVTSREGAVDPGQLANGIWQALITTAAGLSVAIVAFIGYRYLIARSERHAVDLEEGALKLLETMRRLEDEEQPGDEK